MPQRHLAVRIGRHSLMGGAILLLTHSCMSAYRPPAVDSQLAQISGFPVPLVARGYAVHQAKCAKCHSFQDPAAYQPADLEQRIIPVMGRKAKLTDDDQKALLAYLLTARKMTEAAAR